MSLQLEIKKKFRNFHLEVSLRADREWVGLLGTSGCGKSMTLKCIAGIVTPDEGIITINGKTVFDSSRKINLTPQQRHTGYLFQSYALFPNMTVRNNLEIIRKAQGKRSSKSSIENILKRLHLSELADRLPSQLSGGQQQRVALARILVMNPEIVMLDEPFSALDQYLRNQIEMELKEYLDEFQGTVLFVSHNRDEIYRICHRMEILEQGHIVASGKTHVIFREPETVAAAKLTGCKNIARAIPLNTHRIQIPEWDMELETAVNVPQDLDSVGIRAHLIESVNNPSQSNTFLFRSRLFASTPFSQTELLYKAHSLSAAQTPLQREISVNEVVHVEDTQTQTEGYYRLPPEHLLLLKKTRH